MRRTHPKTVAREAHRQRASRTWAPTPGWHRRRMRASRARWRRRARRSSTPRPRASTSRATAASRSSRAVRCRRSSSSSSSAARRRAWRHHRSVRRRQFSSPIAHSSEASLVAVPRAGAARWTTSLATRARCRRCAPRCVAAPLTLSPGVQPRQCPSPLPSLYLSSLQPKIDANSRRLAASRRPKGAHVTQHLFDHAASLEQKRLLQREAAKREQMVATKPRITARGRMHVTSTPGVSVSDRLFDEAKARRERAEANIKRQAREDQEVSVFVPHLFA